MDRRRRHMDVPEDEQPFLEAAEGRIRDHAVDRRRAGRTDVIHAVVRSTTGAVYEGVPFESDAPQFNYCAERHAINELRFAEPGTGAVDVILVAGPVPDADASVTTPCGACRHAIDEFGDDPTVYCGTFVREEEGWELFAKLERYDATELYPHHRPHPTWD